MVYGGVDRKKKKLKWKMKTVSISDSYMTVSSYVEYHLNLAKNFQLKRWVKQIISDYGLESNVVDWRDNDCLKEFLLAYPNDLENLVNETTGQKRA